MIVGIGQGDLQQWNGYMHGYQKSKKTKKPFGKDFSLSMQHVDSGKIRQQQMSFDPILQKYRSQATQIKAQTKEAVDKDKIMANFYKSSRSQEYDIITLYGDTYQNKIPKNKAPVRNIYNPINNQELPSIYFHNRDIRINPEKEFKDIKPKVRDFNIVTGRYNQNHEERSASEMKLSDSRAIRKSQQRQYNPVSARNFDESKQQQYEQKIVKEEHEHSSGEHFNKRLPPTYLNRQPLILDPTKPAPQSIINIEAKRINEKQRYRLKYLIEKQYQTRNEEYELRKERMAINRVHNSHSMDIKAKQFDINELHQIKNDLKHRISNVDERRYPVRLQELANSPKSDGYSQRNFQSRGSNSSERSSISCYKFYIIIWQICLNKPYDIVEIPT